MQTKPRIVYTNRGNQLDLTDPKPNAVDIDDIGWSLSNVCRFGGHSKVFFSLAEHAVAVSYMVSEKLAGQAFAYNFPCAYLGDMWVSKHFHWTVERWRVWKAISERFGVRYDIYGDVEFADRLATSTELRELTTFPTSAWSGLPQPMSVDVEPIGKEHAYHIFLRRYRSLKSEKLLK